MTRFEVVVPIEDKVYAVLGIVEYDVPLAQVIQREGVDSIMRILDRAGFSDGINEDYLEGDDCFLFHDVLTTKPTQLTIFDNDMRDEALAGDSIDHHAIVILRYIREE